MITHPKTKFKIAAIILLAVSVKMVALSVLGLLFTNDFVKYTSYLSRTSDLTVKFLLYLLLSDLIIIYILTQVTRTFLYATNSIRKFFIMSMTTVLIFWFSDFFFLIEIKSNQLVQHVFAAIILLNKYIVFFLICSAYNMEINKLSDAQKNKFFYDHSKFIFRKLIPRKIFLSSKFLYNPLFNIPIYAGLLIYINYTLLHLYENSIVFYISLLLCCVINIYLLVFVIHQLYTIFETFKRFISLHGGFDNKAA